MKSKRKGIGIKTEKRAGQAGKRLDNMVVGPRGCKALEHTHHATNVGKTLKEMSQKYCIVPGTNGMIGEVADDLVATDDVRKTMHLPCMHDDVACVIDKATGNEKATFISERKKVLMRDERMLDKYSNDTLRLHALLTCDKVTLSDVDDFLTDFTTHVMDKCLQKENTKSVLDDEIGLNHDIVAINNVDYRAKRDASGLVTKIQLVKTKYAHTCHKCRGTIQAGTKCATSFVLTEESKKQVFDFEIQAVEDRLDGTLESVTGISFAKLPKKRVWVCGACLHKLVEMAKDIEMEYLEADAYDFEFEDD